MSANKGRKIDQSSSIWEITVESLKKYAYRLGIWFGLCFMNMRKLISNITLTRKQNHPNYKSFVTYFQVDEK